MRFQRVDDWLRWQESLHPHEIELGLDRVKQAYDGLGINFSTPHCRVITVAGTNGKGSCVAYLSHLLQVLGMRVGSYTSPHLLRYHERIQVNGHCISDADLLFAFDAVDRARGDISLTYFEFGTLAAFAHFARQNCDVWVLEVGLGGRLDAVNIIDPDIALISRIGLDHMDWLGDTREQIAVEKAGILRRNRPFVCAEPDPPASLRQVAEQLGVTAYYVGEDFFVDDATDANHWQWRNAQYCLSSLPLPAMPGHFQRINLAAVLQCLALFAPQALDPDLLTREIPRVTLPARAQVVGESPLRLLDVAHNEQAVEALAQVVREHQKRYPGQVFAVFSLLARKDVNGVIAAIAPLVDNWLLAPIAGQASIDPQRVQSLIQSYAEKQGKTVNCNIGVSLREQWQLALSQARANDIVIAFGSFHTVAEILND